MIRWLLPAPDSQVDWRNTGEMAMHSPDDKSYEYACHEGNYALLGILAGAREQEEKEASKAGTAK